MTKRILAIDYGEKRIGLAISDLLGFTVQPLPYLENKNQDFFISALQKIVQEKSVEQIVLGLPVSLDGTLGKKALEIQALAQPIQEACRVPVAFQDERFTTRDAEDFLIEELNMSRKKRREIKDALAACLLLEQFLKK